MTVPAAPKKSKPFLPDLENKAKQDTSGIQEVWLTPDGQIAEKQSISLEGGVGKRTKRSDYDDLPNGHWEFEDDMHQDKAVGFIYIIKDENTGMFYLGKKFYVGNGKLNKGVESNWKWYISSCKQLSESIKLHGKDGFKFYCIEEYQFRGSLGFAETWSLCQVEALANRDKWYNGLIGKVSWTVKEPITDRHKRRMEMVLSGKI